MERDWQDFKALYSNISGAREAFERACETLFRTQFINKNVQQVIVKRGDEGVDIFVGDFGTEPITVIQCKFFLNELSGGQHSQINNSFIKSMNSDKYKLKNWILAIPRNFTIAEHDWWGKWKKKKEAEFSLSSDFIKLQSGNELIDLMKIHGIYETVFKIEELILAKDTNFKVSELYAKSQEKIENEIKLPIYRDGIQMVDALWNLLNDKFVFSAETMAINFRGILSRSGHSISDFSMLLGLEKSELNLYLNGEKLPSLDILYRLSRMMNLDMKFFFTPNFNGDDSIITSDIVRFSILKLVKPPSSIQNIKNINSFIGSTLYQIAKKNVYLYEIVTGKHNSLDKYPSDLSEKFKAELARQYYKLLEQVSSYDKEPLKLGGYALDFTLTESLVIGIYPRIIIETVKEITINSAGAPIVKAYFDDEIREKVIYGRTYDAENLQMIFYGKKDL